MYEVKVDFLLHDGGTKFYETVLIQNDRTGKFMLLKRYGSMAKLVGGGTILIDDSPRLPFANAERNRILMEKRKIRSGKGQYNDELNKSGRVLTTNSVAGATLWDQILKHYDDRATRMLLDKHFNFTGDMTVVVPDTLESDEVVDEVEEPAPIVRGTDWASW